MLKKLIASIVSHPGPPAVVHLPRKHSLIALAGLAGLMALSFASDAGAGSLTSVHQ